MFVCLCVVRLGALGVGFDFVIVFVYFVFLIVLL